MTESSAPASALTPTHVNAVTSFLEGAAISFELIEHMAVESASAEAHATELPPEQVAKTVVLHDGSAYVIAAISAADRLDLNRVRDLLGAPRHLRLATEPEIAHAFPTFELGAIPPFGSIAPTAEVVDRALASQKRILCPAGDHRHSVLVDPADVIRTTAATVADICEQ